MALSKARNGCHSKAIEMFLSARHGKECTGLTSQHTTATVSLRLFKPA